MAGPTVHLPNAHVNIERKLDATYVAADHAAAKQSAIDVAQYARRGPTVHQKVAPVLLKPPPASAQILPAAAPFSAPVLGRIVLLRNPLRTALSLAASWARLHPFFLSPDRLTVIDDRAEEWTRRAIEFAREHLVKEAMRLVKEEYIRFIREEGLMEGLPAGDLSLASLDGRRFSPAAWQAAHQGKALFVAYEDLEEQPAEVLDAMLGFLGVAGEQQLQPSRVECVREVLSQLPLAHASPSSPGLDARLTPLAVFAASLLPSVGGTDSFSSLLPWDYALLLPQLELQRWEADLRPYLEYFHHAHEIDSLKLRAAARWEDERRYAERDNPAAAVHHQLPIEPRERQAAQASILEAGIQALANSKEQRPRVHYPADVSLPKICMQQEKRR